MIFKHLRRNLIFHVLQNANLIASLGLLGERRPDLLE
jgi:hypothetical protein